MGHVVCAYSVAVQESNVPRDGCKVVWLPKFVGVFPGEDPGRNERAF
jgi:hypothetical protein